MSGSKGGFCELLLFAYAGVEVNTVRTRFVPDDGLQEATFNFRA